MLTGGVHVNQRTAKIIRSAALCLPFLLLGYGFLIDAGIIQSPHYMGRDALFLIALPWLLLAVLQYLTPSKTLRDAALKIAGYHIFAALFVVFISGFSEPFIATWSLLLLTSFVYFGKKGIAWSVLAVILTAVAHLSLYASAEHAALETLIGIFSILGLGITGIAISHSQAIDSAELERSKAAESLQRDRILTIVNNLADAVMSTDKDGVIRVYNSASLNLLDTNTSLNGHHLNEIVTIYDQDDAPVDLFGLMSSSKAATVRDDLVLKFGEETVRLEVTFSPIRGGYSRAKRAAAKDGYILIMRDITKAKSLEEERDEFISVVSHELRTPITIAEGTISNVQLMMQRPGISPKLLEDGMTTAHEQVLFLSRMVNDLSTLSRAERGVADTPEPIKVRDLVNDLFTEYAPQAEKKNLHFDLDVASHLGTVTASRLYLKELLQNFITNAIKYTKEGRVTLHVTHKDDQIVFAIQDTGIGISKSDQAKVFKKFYRSEDYRTRETGGTGLGLYVAAKLAKKLNTKIELSSRLNHGSTFSFSLPHETAKK